MPDRLTNQRQARNLQMFLNVPFCSRNFADHGNKGLMNDFRAAVTCSPQQPCKCDAMLDELVNLDRGRGEDSRTPRATCVS